LRPQISQKRTSGPKGPVIGLHLCRDKSPAYPKTQFSATCSAVPFVEGFFQPQPIFTL
jgi:hypothetical protein